MSLTTDPNDPRISHYLGEEKPGPQNEVYLVLSDEELAKGFTRPFRDEYKHVGSPDKPGSGCGTVTCMGYALSATYARNPKFYGATYCCTCRAHFPVAEFVWTKDGKVVGS